MVGRRDHETRIGQRGSSVVMTQERAAGSMRHDDKRMPAFRHRAVQDAGDRDPADFDLGGRRRTRIPDGAGQPGAVLIHGEGQALETGGLGVSGCEAEERGQAKTAKKMRGHAEWKT